MASLADLIRSQSAAAQQQGMSHQDSYSQMDPGMERYLAGQESATRGVPLEAPMLAPDDLIGSGLLKGLLSGAALMGGIKSVGKKAVREAPQAEALRLAQQRAALPVEQYGLGLPANNTPQMRADAMFPQDGYHLSRHGVDVNKLDSGVFAIAPFDAVGTHVGTKEAANARWEALSGRHPDDVKGVSYPVRFADQLPMTSSGKPFDEQTLSEFLRSRHDYDNGDYRALNAKTREELFKDYTNIPYVNDVEAAGSISNIVHPDNIRSRFAAFDPWRRNAAIASAMGVAAPDLLAAENPDSTRSLKDLIP